jgi:multiple antibiotic resistance protein
MDIFFQALISYMVIVDPAGVALIFHALSRNQGDDYRKKMALRAVLISFLLIIFFGFFGEWLLKSLSISLESFKIAGGLLLFYTAFRMVVATDQPASSDELQTADDISVYPLSIPLLAGPGCLTLTVLLFTAQSGGIAGYLQILLAITLVFLIVLGCLLGAKAVAEVLGETGNSIMKRLLGVILAALSIQFIADGIRGFIG